MKLLWSLSLGTLVLSTPLFAQNLTQVRVTSAQAQELAESYESEGYDLLEGSVGTNSFDLVVTDEEMQSLQELMFRITKKVVWIQQIVSQHLKTEKQELFLKLIIFKAKHMVSL